jgi:hypothetical protein
MDVTRPDLMLAAMAAHGSPFSIEQLRKLLFFFNHEASKYGPDLHDFVLRYGYYDIQIEGHLSALQQADLISSHPVLTTCVMLTSAGRDRGSAVLDTLRPEARDYFVRASAFVRSVSFSSLASIVDAADASVSLAPSPSKSRVGST